MSACPASGVLPNTMRAWRDGVIVGKESGQLVVHTARDGVPFLLHGHLSLALSLTFVSLGVRGGPYSAGPLHTAWWSGMYLTHPDSEHHVSLSRGREVHLRGRSHLCSVHAAG